MYELTKELRFEAAHALHHLPDDHKCRNLHGHSYRVVLHLRGVLNDGAFVVDFGDVKAAAKPVIDRLDHAFLAGPGCPYEDGVEVAGGKVVQFDVPTSAECLSKWLFTTLKPDIPRLVAVTLYETVTASATYPAAY